MTTLEQNIQSIITRATHEIADAVRSSIQQEMSRLMAGAAPAPAPAKAAPVKAHAPAAPAAKVPGKRGPKGGWKRKLITADELNVVLGVLGKKPGLTSVQIQHDAGIDAKQAARVLNKLRETGKVKWKGERSAAAYSLAS